jgi:2-oxoisovalerate dehydrogenase E1 component
MTGEAMITTQQIEKSVDQLGLLKLMYLSREGDRREGILLRQSKGWFQVAGIGHEAFGVVSTLLNESDYLFPYYRDRAMVLGRGVTNYDLALAYFAKQKSSSCGRQMPGHYSSAAHNVWSTATPTGSNMLPACGMAWAMQLQGKSDIVVASVGDAASRQGEFYEAVCFAVERQLPVIFIVEDNGYGISTNTDKFNPFKLGIFADKIGVQHVDARDPMVLEKAAIEAIGKARRGDGPTFLHCEVDRLCSHTSSDDHRVYRDPEDISAMMERDPIDMFAQRLIDAGKLTPDQWSEIQQEIDQQVRADYDRAESEQDPSADEVLDHLLAPMPEPKVPPIAGNRQLRMVDAVNEVFADALKNDDRVVFFGEDIEDPKGGVFGLTKDLSNAHPDRVFNSPLAEATIAGVACGMASQGMRPVFEIQFMDFIAPAWNQISQNLATLRWRTGGDWKCPAVFYAPYGAYLPGGSLWHSQANESWLAHTPGLRVVCPSTPEDAAGLMVTAMQADDPTFVLLPKHIIRSQVNVGEMEAVPFGKAKVLQEGDDVTIVSWGNCLELAFAAAERLGDVSVEVIDLRSIQPWDRETLKTSIAKTGRLIVVQEDAESCSAGQMIISELTGTEDSWYSFISPPQLISRSDVHIGYNPILEYAALPDVDDVVDAIQRVMAE